MAASGLFDVDGRAVLGRSDPFWDYILLHPGVCTTSKNARHTLEYAHPQAASGTPHARRPAV